MFSIFFNVLKYLAGRTCLFEKKQFVKYYTVALVKQNIDMTDGMYLFSLWVKHIAGLFWNLI